MCGIIAVVRRAGAIGACSPADVARPLLDGRRACSARPRRDLGRPTRRAAAAGWLDAVDAAAPRRARACAAARATAPLVEPRSTPRRAPGRRLRSPRSSATLDERRLGDAELEAANAALSPVKDALLGRRARPAAHRPRGRRAGRPRRRPGRHRGLHRRSAGAVGLDRLEVRGRDSAGLHLLVRGPRPRPRPIRRRPARRPTRVPTRCSAPAPCGRPTGQLSFVYKAAAEIGELGDNTRALRDAIRGRRAAAPGPRGADGRGASCSATPAGPASASSPSPTPTRSTAEELGRHRRCRTSTARAQRRRRQLRRPQGRRRRCASPPRSPPTPR